MTNTLPSNASYGIVKGRFLLAYADGIDADLYPDGAAAKGSIMFTPSAANIKDWTASPVPVTMLPATVECVLDSEGYLLGKDGSRGVRLLATNDPDLNPGDWTWRVDYFLTDQDDTPTRGIPTHHIEVPGFTGENEVDLTIVAPVQAGDGVFYTRGQDGDSAYQVDVNNGYVGTVEQWLEDLRGKTAYEQAVAGGYTGTIEEWNAAHFGESAYEVAVAAGFVGTESQWLASLIGPQGPQGIQGPTGNLENLYATSPITYSLNTIGFAGIELDEILNVTAPTPSTGDVLKWNGTAWVNSANTEAYSLNNLSDVTITGTPTTGDIITYNGTNWVNSTPAAPESPMPAILMMMGA